VLVGLWALNNTVLGLNVKCRLLNDFGACLLIAITEVSAPSVEYSLPPEEQARIQAEEDARVQADAEARRLRALDDAVQAAAWDLDFAVDELTAIAEGVSDAAGNATDSVEDVAEAVADMWDAYADLEAEAYGPVDDYHSDRVGYALDSVGYAQDGVGYAVESVGWDAEIIEDGLAERADLLGGVESAMGDLESALAASPGSVPSVTPDQVRRAVAEAEAHFADGQSEWRAANARMVELVEEADGIMAEAEALAASFGAD